MTAFDPDRFLIDAAGADLAPFLSAPQLATLRDCASGEEREWFIVRMVELAALIQAMPRTYEQDGKGDQAVAHLHYFTGSANWYIIEKDSDPDGEGQIQAFGLADLFGDGGELGYINLAELARCGAELDLHWKPRTLAQVRAGRERGNR